MKETDSS